MVSMSSKESHNSSTYCIVSTGRSGSSFLAHVLSEAGADFGFSQGDDWDPVKGSLEHPWAHAAYAYEHKIATINESIFPSFLGKQFFEKKRDALIRKIASLNFVKATKLVYLTPYIARYNDVRVVVIYRDFQSYFLSRHKKYPNMSFYACEQTYVDTYNTALAQLQLFGGVVLNFDDILRTDNEAWSEVLSSLVGIEKQDILNARNKLSNSTLAKKRATVVRSRICDDVFAQLESLKNIVHESK